MSRRSLSALRLARELFCNCSSTWRSPSICRPGQHQHLQLTYILIRLYTVQNQGPVIACSDLNCSRLQAIADAQVFLQKILGIMSIASKRLGSRRMLEVTQCHHLVPGTTLLHGLAEHIRKHINTMQASELTLLTLFVYECKYKLQSTAKMFLFSSLPNATSDQQWKQRSGRILSKPSEEEGKV